MAQPAPPQPRRANLEAARRLYAEADRIVVVGRYLGSARGSGCSHEASFAHVLRLRDGRIAELIQITDTKRWHDALRG